MQADYKTAVERNAASRRQNTQFVSFSKHRSEPKKFSSVPARRSVNTKLFRLGLPVVEESYSKTFSDHDD